MAGLLESHVSVVRLYGLKTNKAVDFSGATSVTLPAGTTIDGVSGGKPVTATLGTTGTSSDYVTDGTADNVQLQAAVTDVSAAGGGIVTIRSGTYAIAGVVTVPANVIIEGEGDSTVLVMAAASAIKVNSSDVVIRNLTINGDSQAINNYGIIVENAVNVEIHSNKFLNMEGFGIFITATASNTCSDINVHDNYLYGNGNNDVIGGGPANSTGAVVKDVNIHHNRIIQDCTTNSYENAFDIVKVNRVQFSDNSVTGKVQFGTEQYPNINSQINNNVIEPAINKTTTAVLVTTFGTALSNNKNITICGNVVIDGAIKLTGISGQKVTHFVITGNLIESAAVANGLELTYCSSGVVSGNEINDCTAAVYLENCDNIVVDGNNINSATYGVRDVTGVASIKVGLNNYNSVTTPVVGTYLEPHAQGNVTGATTFNVVNGRMINATLTGNITVTLTAGEFKNQELTLKLTQDGTGSRTVTWPSNFKKAGGTLTLTVTAAAVDVINMRYDGTNWIETSRALNIS